MSENIKIPSAVMTAITASNRHPEWFFFPLPRGRKFPPPSNMLNDGARPPGATNDPAIIAKWKTANVGIAPHASRLTLMDVDTKPGKVGEQTLAALIAKHGPLPPTLTVRTPSGGRHYWFYETLEVQHHFGVGAFGRDVDCPQYVLLPNSVIVEGGKVVGRYTVIDQSPIAAAPLWFAEYLKAREAAPTIGDNDAPAVELDLPENIERGIYFLKNDAKPSIQFKGGEEALFDTAAVLKDLGISYDTAVELINEHYNVEDKCEPLWNLREGPDEDRLEKKIRNAYDYATLIQPGALGITPEEDFGAAGLEDAEEAAALDKLMNDWKLRDRIQRGEMYDHRDFLLYLPGADKTKFIFTATGSEEFWSASAINLKCKPQPIIDPRKKGKTPDECEKIDGTRDHWLRKVDEQGKNVLDKDGRTIIAYQAAAEWIKENPKQHVAVVTWWPGKPSVIHDTIVIKEGGVVPKKGMHSFNRYRPPQLSINTPGDPKPWLDHLKLLYPDDWEHILHWLAWRVQHPEQKIMHALVLGGPSRIGKDRLLAPIPYAIGPWNFASTNAQTIMDEPKFTPYLESVVCLIHEAKDFGDQDRYAFYHRIKPWLGGEARGVLMCADKNVKVHAILDVWAAIITTNFKLRGLYIPPDDARLYLAWSKRTRADWVDMDIPEHKLDELYFKPLQRWYESGGYEAVAHYLRTLDLTKVDFSPTAPPPKTEAWHEVVNAGRDHTENAVGRIIEGLGDPAAITVDEVRARDDEGELDWVSAKGRNQVAPQMETAGYVRVMNPGNKSGRWVVGPKNRRREIYIYGQAKLTPAERRKAALERFNLAAEEAKKATDKESVQ